MVLGWLSLKLISMVIPNLSPLWISLKVSLSATLITTILGTIAAYSIYRYQGRGRSLINNLFLTPLLLPPTVVGFILLLLLGKNSPVGQFLAQGNMRVVFTWYGAVIAAAIVSFPLVYRAALGAFSQIDRLLLDAARIEGAAEAEVFWYIAFPLAIPGVLGGIVLGFARALGEFGATLMVAGNIPGQTQTIPMTIYFALEAGEIGEGWFWTMIIMVTSFLGVWLLDIATQR